MDLGIQDKRALVLGASTGLGRAIAEALIAEGARVAIAARSRARLEETARDIGASAAIPCDLSQPGAGLAVGKAAEAALGGIDILVTNTGGPKAGGFMDLGTDDWQAAFQGLWLSAVEAIRAVLPGMRSRGFGRILLLTSIASKEPLPNLTLSNGLRAGLLGLANALSKEVARDGVTVNVLMPGFIETERLMQLGLDRAAVSASIPAGRIGRPSELARVAAFLASEAASYVTGQAIACDGGRLGTI